MRGNGHGPRLTAKLAIPLSPEIIKALTDRAEAENVPKTILARKFILDGLKRAAA